MTYASARSMNADLVEGMSDGKYKKVVSNRGLAEAGTQASRRDLYDRYYGIHEADHKVVADGTDAPTPGYVPTATPMDL